MSVLCKMIEISGNLSGSRLSQTQSTFGESIPAREREPACAVLLLSQFSIVPGKGDKSRFLKKLSAIYTISYSQKLSNNFCTGRLR